MFLTDHRVVATERSGAKLDSAGIDAHATRGEYGAGVHSISDHELASDLSGRVAALSSPGINVTGGGDSVTVEPYARLAELGLKLPGVSAPKGSYVPAIRTGNYVFVSGQIPMVEGELTVIGKVGAEIAVSAARELSRCCVLGALAAIDDLVGLSYVRQVVKVVGFVASAPGFAEQASVVNGASDLLIDVFGPAGRHARSAIGVAELPLGSPVEVELIVEIADCPV